MELVQEYARCKSEEAFATLVSRHVNLVYTVAFRHVHDAHLAQEITQTVFIILARKAGALSSTTVVPGWLCRTARYASDKALKLRYRRQQREQEAYMQSQSSETESTVWTQIEPLLDTAMAGLGEKDYNAVVLRFFKSQNFKDLSMALGTTEAGAKMRVNRALAKLRKFFIKRGLTFSTALIAASIAANSVQAAPLGLAASTTIAATGNMALTTSTSTLIKATLTIMTWTKLKGAIVVGAAVILATGTATIVVQHAKSGAGTSALKFVGYATPEAAVESMLWTARAGEPMERLADGITPDQLEDFKARMAGKSDAEIKQACIAWANSLAGYKITQKDVISNEEVHLHIHATPLANGLHTGHVVLIMKKLGGTWKFAGDVP